MTLKPSHVHLLLRDNPGKYLIMKQKCTHGKTFLVKKDNPLEIVAQISRQILNEIETEILTVPVVFYETQPKMN